MQPQEKQRLNALRVDEKELRLQGCRLIAGVDEAGRGPLAGPVVAAACIIPESCFIAGVNDSKKLSPNQRKEIFSDLQNDPTILKGIGIATHTEIDQLNILQATILAMKRAVEALSVQPDYLLIDGLGFSDYLIPNRKVIHGDATSYLIGAASILAKETRDRIMEEYDEKWPSYGFRKHKGYGTEFHRDAIRKYGACPIHRMTFAPLNNR